MKIKISFLFYFLEIISVCFSAELPVPSGTFTFEGKPFLGTATLTNTIVRSNVLYLNGEYSMDTAVFRPLIFNYERFTIVAKIQPEETLTNKTMLVGGTSSRWLALSLEP